MNKLNVILLILALLSGFAVVTVQNQSREYHIAFDKAEKKAMVLEQEYSRLKLEQAKYANHQLIKAAAEKQHLHPPLPNETKIIEMK